MPANGGRGKLMANQRGDAGMDLSNHQLEVLAIVLAIVMGAIALGNWLNRRHGGFLRGWAGAVFIGICWIAAIAVIFIKVSH